jgi:hypothetical protein
MQMYTDVYRCIDDIGHCRLPYVGVYHYIYKYIYRVVLVGWCENKRTFAKPWSDVLMVNHHVLRLDKSL